VTGNITPRLNPRRRSIFSSGKRLCPKTHGTPTSRKSIFTVAHSDEADVVDTIYRILNEPHESGAAFGAVKKQFLDLRQAEDWYGKQTAC
jgi:hypothetical protein